MYRWLLCVLSCVFLVAIGCGGDSQSAGDDAGDRPSAASEVEDDTGERLSSAFGGCVAEGNYEDSLDTSDPLVGPYPGAHQDWAERADDEVGGWVYMLDGDSEGSEVFVFESEDTAKKMESEVEGAQRHRNAVIVYPEGRAPTGAESEAVRRCLATDSVYVPAE